MFPYKDHDFEHKWSKMKTITTHDGVEISKSGQLMSKEFKQRKKHLEFLERKYNKTKHTSGIRIDDISEKERVFSKINGDTNHLEIVKEDNTYSENEDNDSQWFED